MSNEPIFSVLTGKGCLKAVRLFGKTDMLMARRTAGGMPGPVDQTCKLV
jgi:hypothetical protein